MNIELSASIFTASISAIIGLFILIKNSNSATNRYFSYFTFCLSLYSLFNYFSTSAETNSEAFFWSKLILYSLLPIGPLFFLFVHTFPSAKEEIGVKVRLLFLSWIVIQIPLIALNLVFQSVELVGKNVNVVAGPAIIFFMPIHIGLILLASWGLIKKYRKAKGLSKVQLEYITWGILTSLILTLFATAVLGVLLGISILIPISPLFLIVAVLSITYAIIKHRLLDIRLIVARAVAYLSLIVFIGLGYIAFLFNIAVLVNNNQPTKDTFREMIVPAIIALVFAISFQPLRRFFERITNKIFYKDNYNAQELLWSLSRIMASTLNLSHLSQRILDRMLSDMKISYGSIVLTRQKSVIWVGSEGNTMGHPFKGTEIFHIIEQSYNPHSKGEQLIVYEELSDSPVKKIMRDHEITIVLPLVVRKELIGGMLLGNKSSGEIYSSEDIDVLKIIAPEIAVAVNNSLSFDEIKRFNVTLEEEIKHATERLRKANTRLKELDNLKDEFVSIASHELRTPMTAIKSYLWMAINQPGQKIKDPLSKYLDISYNSTERLIRLVNDMLTVSRIERNKIELKIVEVDIFDTLKQVYEELKVTADERKIHFSLVGKEHGPYVLDGDKEKLREVFQNIIGNALKFTSAGGKIKLDISKLNGTIRIAISDTGPGIHKDSIKDLFKKFSKIEYSYAKHSSQPGTGLGLYISKQIVSLHGGDIQVESVVDVGTTFTVILPTVKKRKELKSI